MSLTSIISYPLVGIQTKWRKRPALLIGMGVLLKASKTALTEHVVSSLPLKGLLSPYKYCMYVTYTP